MKDTDLRVAGIGKEGRDQGSLVCEDQVDHLGITKSESVLVAHSISSTLLMNVTSHLTNTTIAPNLFSSSVIIWTTCGSSISLSSFTLSATSSFQSRNFRRASSRAIAALGCRRHDV